MPCGNEMHLEDGEIFICVTRAIEQVAREIAGDKGMRQGWWTLPGLGER